MSFNEAIIIIIIKDTNGTEMLDETTSSQRLLQDERSEGGMNGPSKVCFSQTFDL